MSNALMIYQEFDSIQRAAMALYKSNYFSDAKSEAQAIVKVMAGAELGLPPFASMAGIHIIQGKPVLGANVIATLVKNDPRYNYHVEQSDNKACVLKWSENGVSVGHAGFTIEEAQAAGLTNKDNWKKYPSDMLFARAISRGARRFAPGIFGGSPVYTPDEMGADVDEEGNVIEGELVQSEPATNGNGSAAFTVGQQVMVHGDKDEKPGEITGTINGLYQVEVNGKVFKIGADKLSAMPEQEPAGVDAPLFPEPAGESGAYED